MLFSNFSSSPVEKLVQRFTSKRINSPASFIGDALFKGLQFTILWGVAMWALQWSLTDISLQTGVLISLAVGLSTGVWMAVMNQRSKQSLTVHRIGYHQRHQPH